MWFVKYKASVDRVPCHVNKMWGLSVCSCGLLNIRLQLTGCLVILRCGDSVVRWQVCPMVSGNCCWKPGHTSLTFHLTVTSATGATLTLMRGLSHPIPSWTAQVGLVSRSEFGVSDFSPEGDLGDTGIIETDTRAVPFLSAINGTGYRWSCVKAEPNGSK